MRQKRRESIEFLKINMLIPLMKQSCNVYLLFMLSSLLCAGSVCTSQDQIRNAYQPWRWTRFTTESGLPSNHILDLVETASGIVWVATPSGLAWFDGYFWHASDYPVKGVFGKLFHETGDTILFLIGSDAFHGTAGGFTKIPVGNILSIVPYGQSGEIIHRNDSLFHFTVGRLLPIPGSPRMIPSPLHLYSTEKGTVWAHATDGLYQLVGKRWICVIHSGSPAMLSPLAIAENASGTGALSIGLPVSQRGLWVWDAHHPLHYDREANAENITAIDIDEQGNLIGVQPEGEILFRIGETWSMLDVQNSLTKKASVLKIRRDGSLWIGTANGLSLYRSQSTRWAYWRYPGIDRRNRVSEFFPVADSSVWITSEGGLDHRAANGTLLASITIPGLRTPILTGLGQDKEGKIWVSSGSAFDGAYRWNGGSWTHTDIWKNPLGTRIHKIRKDRQGRLWFLGIGAQYSLPDSQGPGAFVLENGQFIRWSTHEGLLSGFVYSFAQGNDGALWFGTRRGLCRFRKGAWKYWTIHDGLPRDYIFGMAFDHSERLWLVFRNSSVVYIDPADSIRTLDSSRSPIREPIWDLAVDDSDKIWFSTPSRIYCYQHDGWRFYSAENGLGDFDVWPVLPLGNKVLAGSYGGGITVLSLGEVDIPPPRLFIQKPISEPSTVLIRWTPYDYFGERSSSSIPTRYRVDNHAWTDWSLSRDATLINLSTGNHEIQIQVMGLFGYVDTTGASATFTVPLPLYLHPLFLGALVIFLGTVLWLGATLIVRKRRHTAELRRSEQKFRRLTEATFEAVVVHDRGTIIDFNEGMVRMFGYRAEELAGRSLFEILGPDLTAAERDHIIKISDGPCEIPGRTKDGSVIRLEVNSRTIASSHQLLNVAAIRDITERKRNEARVFEYQERLRLLASQLATTEEKERRAIATFLHDTVGQALAMCKIKLGELSLPTSDPLRKINSLIEQSIELTQSVTFDLSPPILYELGFTDAVEWLIEKKQSEYGISISFDCDRPFPLPLQTRAILFHAVRELLLNVAKHAKASQARVIILQTGQEIEIRVEDNGIGIVPSGAVLHPNHTGGFGLFNIRERIRQIDGQLAIQSNGGQGTSVIIRVPA
jgi:PAS domain S-box-containing protein